MADVKISELSALTTPDGAEELVVNDSGTTKKITIEDLFAGDNVKAKFGAGDDLQIYHSGSHSYISDEGTGGLILTTNGAAVYIQKGTAETSAEFNIDGAVKLRYDNVPRFATTSTGVDVSGTVTADGLVVKSGSTTVGSIGSSSGKLKVSSVNTGLIFADAFDEIYPLTNGVTTLGDAGAKFKDLYLSGGVYLGGTGAANKLDDYESGNFTPTLTFGGASVGMIHSFQAGFYTRVGNIVTATFRINVSAKGTSTGVAAIAGFPFAPATGNGNNSGAAGYVSGVASDGMLILNLWPQSTNASFYEKADSGTATNMQHTSFTNATYIAMSVTYRTA